MRNLNEYLFLVLNASADPDAGVLWLAKFLADYALWLVPLALTAGWLRGSEHTRKCMLEATASGLAGLLINQVVGLVWQHPRPFMMGLGHQLIPHVADSSFPSDHLTLLWAVAFSFLMHKRFRPAGALLAVLGVPVAWARIYLGVHFPMDMAGAALVAGLSAWLCMRGQRWLAGPIFDWTTSAYRLFFAPLIRRGWVRE